MTGPNAPAAEQPTNQPEITPPAEQEQPSLAEQLGIDPEVASSRPDSDEARLLAAVTEADAEEAANAEQAGAAEQPGTQQQPQQPGQQQAPGPQPQVPLAALRSEREQRRNVELELAQERGARQTLEQLVLRGAVTPEMARAVQEGRAELPGQQAPQDPFATVNARELEVAQQYENGEISYVDLKKAEQKIAADRRRIEDEVASQNAQQRALQQSQPRTEQIEQAFPSLQTISQEQLDACGPLARHNAQMVLNQRGLGVFDQRNPQHLAVFQFQVAKLADSQFNGGRDYAALRAARSGQPTGQQPQGQGQPQPQTPARVTTPVPGRVTDPAQLVRDKVNLSERMPPDTSGIQERGSQPQSGVEDRVVTMTTEQIAALPKEVLNQMLGLS